MRRNRDRPKLKRNREREELRGALKYQPKLERLPVCGDCGKTFKFGDYANKCEGCGQLVCDQCKGARKHQCPKNDERPEG
ncbi:hypothetical protein LCGC14_0455480 [marine sediment metagenome]|uniref:Uncharacterized protein n=1 Tax=marine sediment metagenome TaxID=412755 RepID=A0A0F9SZH9_9ZZZZ